jgi:ketosteroid isomerase-like protein
MTAYTRATQCTILAATLAMATTSAFLPAAAQTTGSEQYQPTAKESGLKQTAAALNAQRGEALRQRNAAAIAEMYTPDATFVELLPRLQVMRGRAEVRRHFEELTKARISDLTFTIISAEMTGRDMSVGGDYVLAAGNNETINGHFFPVASAGRGNMEDCPGDFRPARAGDRWRNR